MESLFKLSGITRQSFFENEARYKKDKAKICTLIEHIKTVRDEQPRLGARKMYHKLSNDPKISADIEHVGRDKFEMILLNNGFRIGKTKAYLKTTVRGPYIFKNLILNFVPDAPDQVWVSDLTYYFVVEQGQVKHYYITFIMDKFTRRCLGFAVSDNMTTECTTLPAMEMALKNRGIGKDQKLPQLIFHSDGGGQYSDKAFLALLARHAVRSSMGKQAYENPNAERLNGIIKNEYLMPWSVNSFGELKSCVPKAVRLYNFERPHFALRYDAPAEFEKKIKDAETQSNVTVFSKN